MFHSLRLLALLKNTTRRQNGLAFEKRSSLFVCGVNEEEKSFATPTLGQKKMKSTVSLSFFLSFSLDQIL
jgi:hypothetical protein